MKKIIDEKGRLFGNISIVDILVIIIAVVLVAAVYVKFHSNERTSTLKDLETVTYVYSIEGVREGVPASIKVGDGLYDQENDVCLQEMTDYYTLWAHQIKTPIAAMRLLFQETPQPELEVELLKIEQYVEMVLGYLRLGSGSTDYVFREESLDLMLRQAVRKYARLFILKKISLDFQETNRSVVTDEKWLSFVIEQLLSNALKYTPEGGQIRIYNDGETVVIADNGIGIQEEDLPRVFEKGFTGFNGRENRKSTGIGLYLCREVMDRLNHDSSISSRPGQGTLVRLDLSRKRSFVE